MYMTWCTNGYLLLTTEKVNLYSEFFSFVINGYLQVLRRDKKVLLIKWSKRSLDIRSPRGWGNTYSWSLICQIQLGKCELSNMECIGGVFSPPQVSQNNASSRLFGSPDQTMRHRLKSGTPTECRSGSSTAAARILPCFRDIFVQKANCICPNCKIYLYELQNVFATKDSRPIWPLCLLLENRPRKTLFGTSWPVL